jgi:hypothetical protein
MSAYSTSTFGAFTDADINAVVGQIQLKYARDPFVRQFPSQVRAWGTSIQLLQQELQTVIKKRPESELWNILIEYPLYRLRRRIDLVILTFSTIYVVELKVGETKFNLSDSRQVEEYALDLRDFHEQSRGRLIIPVLWATAASSINVVRRPEAGSDTVSSVIRVRTEGCSLDNLEGGAPR